MIQRIQSVYLLVTAILMAVTIWSPLLSLQVDGSILGDGEVERIYLFRSLGIMYKESTEPIYWTWGVISTASLTAILAFLNIFLFKKRKLQLKVCNIITSFIILFYIAVGAYLYTGMSTFNAEFLNVEFGIILPLIALIFNILAMTKIKADEKLVQSLNRIR